MDVAATGPSATLTIESAERASIRSANEVGGLAWDDGERPREGAASKFEAEAATERGGRPPLLAAPALGC